MEASMVYMTAGSWEEATRIGRELVESRLAACVNIVEGMRSIYKWEGRIQEDREVIVIAKTKEALVPELVAKVKSVHSYACPCVLALPVDSGNREFIQWVHEQTK